MKKIIFFIVLIIFIVLGIRFIFGGSEDTWICVSGGWVKHGVPSAPKPIEPCGEEPVVCTMDAKLCPDGSYVSRVAPNCEFAPCPGEMEWLAIKQAIANCEVESVWQTHDRRVEAKLKNGEELVSVEPELDDIINLAVAAEEKCGEILMGTE